MAEQDLKAKLDEMAALLEHLPPDRKYKLRKEVGEAMYEEYDNIGVNGAERYPNMRAMLKEYVEQQSSEYQKIAEEDLRPYLFEARLRKESHEVAKSLEGLPREAKLHLLEQVGEALDAVARTKGAKESKTGIARYYEGDITQATDATLNGALYEAVAEYMRAAPDAAKRYFANHKRMSEIVQALEHSSRRDAILDQIGNDVSKDGAFPADKQPKALFDIPTDEWKKKTSEEKWAAFSKEEKMLAEVLAQHCGENKGAKYHAILDKVFFCSSTSFGTRYGNPEKEEERALKIDASGMSNHALRGQYFIFFKAENEELGYDKSKDPNIVVLKFFGNRERHGYMLNEIPVPKEYLQNAKFLELFSKTLEGSAQLRKELAKEKGSGAAATPSAVNPNLPEVAPSPRAYNPELAPSPRPEKIALAEGGSPAAPRVEIAGPPTFIPPSDGAPLNVGERTIPLATDNADMPAPSLSAKATIPRSVDEQAPEPRRVLNPTEKRIKDGVDYAWNHAGEAFAYAKGAVRKNMATALAAAYAIPSVRVTPEVEAIPLESAPNPRPAAIKPIAEPDVGTEGIKPIADTSAARIAELQQQLAASRAETKTERQAKETAQKDLSAMRTNLESALKTLETQIQLNRELTTQQEKRAAEVAAANARADKADAHANQLERLAGLVTPFAAGAGIAAVAAPLVPKANNVATISPKPVQQPSVAAPTAPIASVPAPVAAPKEKSEPEKMFDALGLAFGKKVMAAADQKPYDFDGKSGHIGFDATSPQQVSIANAQAASLRFSNAVKDLAGTSIPGASVSRQIDLQGTSGAKPILYVRMTEAEKDAARVKTDVRVGWDNKPHTYITTKEGKSINTAAEVKIVTVNPDGSLKVDENGKPVIEDAKQALKPAPVPAPVVHAAQPAMQPIVIGMVNSGAPLPPPSFCPPTPPRGFRIGK